MAEHPFPPVDPSIAAEPLYFVELLGADALNERERAALEGDFRAALDQVCGSPDRAAGAVHAHWDCDEHSLDPARGGVGYFDVLCAEAMARLAARVPAGAHFACTPNFEALARPRA